MYSPNLYVVTGAFLDTLANGVDGIALDRGNVEQYYQRPKEYDGSADNQQCCLCYFVEYTAALHSLWLMYGGWCRWLRRLPPDTVLKTFAKIVKNNVPMLP